MPGGCDSRGMGRLLRAAGHKQEVQSPTKSIRPAKSTQRVLPANTCLHCAAAPPDNDIVARRACEARHGNDRSDGCGQHVTPLLLLLRQRLRRRHLYALRADEQRAPGTALGAVQHLLLQQARGALRLQLACTVQCGHTAAGSRWQLRLCVQQQQRPAVAAPAAATRNDLHRAALGAQRNQALGAAGRWQKRKRGDLVRGLVLACRALALKAQQAGASCKPQHAAMRGARVQRLLQQRLQAEKLLAALGQAGDLCTPTCSVALSSVRATQAEGLKPCAVVLLVQHTRRTRAWHTLPSTTSSLRTTRSEAASSPAAMLLLLLPLCCPALRLRDTHTNCMRQTCG